MPDPSSLSKLTRSLMIGASLGSVPLLQVGCAPVEVAGPASADGAPSTVAVASQAERSLCEQVLATRSAGDVDRLMTEFPSSRCIAPLLNALPAPTLASLSPQAVAGLDASVVGRLSPRVAAQLPVSVRPASASRERRTDGGDDDARY